MRAPTREQKAKEAAVFYTCLADVIILVLMVIFALSTLSLSLLSESIRAGLMIVVEVYALFVLRAVHRDRLQKFRYGIGKVEQMCNLAIGAALVLSGFWVANSVVDTLLFAHRAATPLGLASAAAVNSVCTVENGLGWLVMLAASKTDDSAIYQAQIRARVVKLVSSGIVLTAMTIAALAKDPVVATLFDCIGAAFVAVVMVTIGFKMITECLPDLLDHPVPRGTKKEIEAGLLSAGIAREEVVRIRTRRAGSIPHVEVTLAPAGGASIADYCRRAASVEGRLQDHLRGADVSVVVEALEPQPS
jgi:divalent metal cation (Fe/Co/Zn/Cd) transporter